MLAAVIGAKEMGEQVLPGPVLCTAVWLARAADGLPIERADLPLARIGRVLSDARALAGLWVGWCDLRR